MTYTPKPLRYADVLRDAAESYRAKAEHNRNQPFPEDAIVASGEVLWRAQARRAAALRQLADLCEEAEQHLVAEYPTNTRFNAEAQRLVRDIAAGYQEGRATLVDTLCVRPDTSFRVPEPKEGK